MRYLETANRQPDVWAINVIAFFILSLPLLFGMLSENERMELQQAWTGQAKWVSLYLGIFSTAVPGVCYAYVSMKLPPILSTSLRYLTPVVATILAIIFLKEIPGVNIYIGGVLVLSGLLWMTFAGRRNLKPVDG
jgi:drug/metabolite transporter (DMT)-like permease